MVTTATTIAVKRTADQTSSVVVAPVTASPLAPPVTVIKTAVAQSANPFANPWLRAVALSPSVYRFLTAASFGARDFGSLTVQMIKPSNAVLMTFSADPNPGLDHDRFTGTALVAVPTVIYAMRTASLQ